jgi:predicted house-cleaning NTP pyrophosphatase (Maf/HAM1 superfamily)
VHYRVLSDSLITCYLELAKPYQCAGSMRSEFAQIQLAEKIESDDPDALLGLPLRRLYELINIEARWIFERENSI